MSKMSATVAPEAEHARGLPVEHEHSLHRAKQRSSIKTVLVSLLQDRMARLGGGEWVVGVGAWPASV
jgi:hypothetical protein